MKSLLTDLVIDFAKGWCHLICYGAGNYDAICLARWCSEYHSISVHIVSWCSDVHHLYCTASEAESKRPDWSLQNNIDLSLIMVWVAIGEICLPTRNWVCGFWLMDQQYHFACNLILKWLIVRISKANYTCCAMTC